MTKLNVCLYLNKGDYDAFAKLCETELLQSVSQAVNRFMRDTVRNHKAVRND